MMKRPYAFCTLFLALGFAGGFVLGWRATPKNSGIEPRPQTNIQTRALAGDRAHQKPAKPRSVETAAGASDGIGNLEFDFVEGIRQLRSGQYKRFTERVRSLGVPDHMIAAMIESQISVGAEAKIQKLREQYWRDNSALVQKLEDETNSTIREALAESGLRLQGETALPQQAQIEKYYDEFNDPEKLSALGVGPVNRSEYLRELEQQKFGELSGFMSDEQLREYKYRHSILSRLLARQSDGIGLSEDEFRIIYDSMDQKADAWRQRENGTISESEQQSIQARAEADLKAALGPDRYAEYQMSLNPAFGDIKSIAAKQSLPNESIHQFYDLVRQVRYGGLRARRESPSAFIRETRQRATEIIGEDGVKELVAKGIDIKVFGYSIREP